MRAGEPLLAVPRRMRASSPRRVGVEHLGGRLPRRRVHAHVQGRVLRVGEAAVAPRRAAATRRRGRTARPAPRRCRAGRARRGSRRRRRAPYVACLLLYWFQFLSLAARRLRRAPATCSPSSARRAVAGRAVRPRRLLAAARRGRARLRLRAGRAAGHADGPDGAASPPPTSLNTYPARATWPASCATTARSGSPARIADAVVRERGSEPFTDQRAAGRRSCATSIPAATPAHRRQPGQAHVPGAAHRGQRRARGPASARCRPPSTRSRSAAGSS